MRSLLLCAVFALTDCACAPRPTVAPQAPPPSPAADTASRDIVAARKLARDLDPRTKEFNATVDHILASGDWEAQQTAHQVIRRYSTWLNSKAWTTGERNYLAAWNKAQHLVLSRAQLDGQVEHWRAQHLRRARRAQLALGDRTVIDAAFQEAENIDLTRAERQVALSFLGHDVRALTPQERSRLRQANENLLRPNNLSGVSPFKKQFRSCYEAALGRHSKEGTTQYAIRLDIGAEGNVAAASVTLVGEASREDTQLTECIRDVVLTGKFPRPEGGAAVVNVPLTLSMGKSQ